MPLFSARSAVVSPESIRLPALMAFFLYFPIPARPCSTGFAGPFALADHLPSRPRAGDGLLHPGLPLLGPAEALLDDVVHLAQAVVNALRDPAPLADEIPPSGDRLLQRRPLGPRMPAPARRP